MTEVGNYNLVSIYDKLPIFLRKIMEKAGYA